MRQQSQQPSELRLSRPSSPISSLETRHVNESNPEGRLYGNPADRCSVDLWPGPWLEGRLERPQ